MLVSVGYNLLIKGTVLGVGGGVNRAGSNMDTGWKICG